RQMSYDSVRKIVQAEGKSARNLVKFDVPILSPQPDNAPKNFGPRGSSVRPASRSLSRPRSTAKKPDSDHGKSPEGSRTPSGKRTDLRARYWAYLFENLSRAVDEIYVTCETDDSTLECKEVIMMLEQFTKDFKSLIERMDLMRTYEHDTKVGQRPQSLAWELRKSSPGKNLSSSGKENFMPSPSVSRSLNFGTTSKSPEPVTAASWADRVKGIKSTPDSKQENGVVSAEDCDGWETVQRNSRSRTRPTSAGSSHGLQKELLKRIVEGPQSKQPALLKRSSSMLDTLTPQPHTQQPISSLSAENLSKHCGGVNDKNLAIEAFVKSIRRHSQDGGIPLAWQPKREDDLSSEEDEILATRLESVESALQDALDEEDQLQDQLELETDAALASAIQEEETWRKELEREENACVPEVDLEEGVATTEGGSDLASSLLPKPIDWESIESEYDGKMSSGMGTSWVDIIEEAESRTPGRVVDLHEKLSSPSRKRSPTESKRRHEEKQAKARELREKLLQDKAERLRVLSKKVEEMQVWKEELLSQKKSSMDRRLQRAEEKRQLQLQLRIRKAHEEEAKANEIAFINQLSAQNKRHDIMSKLHESEARLQDIQEERIRKHEEKLAKEAKAEERRKALEADRLARLQEMQEKRKQRQNEFEQRQMEKEKGRQEVARAKERDRDERIAALNQQQQTHIQQLQKKIQKRQDDTDRRHKEKLERIQEKAFRMSILQHSVEDEASGDRTPQPPPKLIPYEKKKICDACNVLIPSEVHLLSHLRGTKHQQMLSESDNQTRKEIVRRFRAVYLSVFNRVSDAPVDRQDPKQVSDKERRKSLKKRCKKLRQRMTQRGSEYETSLTAKSSPSSANDSENRNKLQKLVKDLVKYVSSTHDTGPWPQNKAHALDRALGEIARTLDKKVTNDPIVLKNAGGLTALCRILMVIADSSNDMAPVIPQKSLLLACSVLKSCCKGVVDNCQYMLFSNKISLLIDLLSHQLDVRCIVSKYSHFAFWNEFPQMVAPVENASSSSWQCSPVTSCLLQTLACIISGLVKNQQSAEKLTNQQREAMTSRNNDVISYLVSVGVVDRLTMFFNSIRGSIDGDASLAEFLQHGISLLSSVTRLLSRRLTNRIVLNRLTYFLLSRTGSIFDDLRPDDSCQFLATLGTTDLAGLISLLYGVLLHAGAPGRGEQAPSPLPPHIVLTACAAFRLLNHLAVLDIHFFQSMLCEEGTSLEFRHVALHLLWVCSHQAHDELLHELILCIGYFSVLNGDNQAVVRSGHRPSILQQLCSLPFQYFSHPRLTSLLFPTLIACCYGSEDNRAILSQELSCALLHNFLQVRYEF
ncbi:hypothetical protein CAPTEDRAFT_90932, partial [Capitella teleta]